MQIAMAQYRIHLRWKTILWMIVVVMVCIKLGLWQLHKAKIRQAMHHALQSDPKHAIAIDAVFLQKSDVETRLDSKRIQVYGRYLPQYQFLLDNQIENGQSGFHVLTPFLVGDSKYVVWVNRGWIAGFTDHQQIPEFSTSEGMQYIHGLAWQIKKPGFQLGSPAKGWQPVQQVIDFEKLRQYVPYLMPTMIIKLDSSVEKDGFIRHWFLPTGEIEKNLGYAYQWFGFALAALLIAFYQMIEKKT